MLLQTIRANAEVQGFSFSEEKGFYVLEKVIAERKAFLTHKKLIYRAKFRINEEEKELLFTEFLKESGFGLTSGAGDDGLSPGFGFKKESYKTGMGPREGSIEEQANLLGKRYNYSFDFGAFRKSLEEIARVEGYSFRWKYSL